MTGRPTHMTLTTTTAHGTALSGFPQMPPSPMVDATMSASPSDHIGFHPPMHSPAAPSLYSHYHPLSGGGARSARSDSAHSTYSATDASGSPADACSIMRHTSRNNFGGSWLDIGSDNEDDYGGSSSGGRRTHMRRKSSGASTSGRVSLANIKEMTRRSSMHFRRLTIKMGVGSSAHN
ncbi:hypothetical protein GGF37_005415 [Kickxella alabastrina]|nr:hypothetical protein GGF37_005415 [Kickxella alabastrina]